MRLLLFASSTTKKRLFASMLSYFEVARFSGVILYYALGTPLFFLGFFFCFMGGRYESQRRDSKSTIDRYGPNAPVNSKYAHFNPNAHDKMFKNQLSSQM